MNQDSELTINRSECYRQLAGLFSAPGFESVSDPGRGAGRPATPEAEPAAQLATALGLLSPEAASWAERMAVAYGRSDLQELAVEHARLFVGPFELKAPPYGSVYLEAGRRVMGESTMEVIGLYREMGLSISESFRDLPDHVAVELEFMYYLVLQQLEAAQAGDVKRTRRYVEAQVLFLDGHLRRWVPRFCAAILAATGSPFYRYFARCLEVFTEADARLLRSALAGTTEEPGPAPEG